MTGQSGIEIPLVKQPVTLETESTASSENSLGAQPALAKEGSNHESLLLAASIIAYIVFSAALINTNKVLLNPSVFPYSVALTWVHVAASALSSLLLLIVSPRLFPEIGVIRAHPGPVLARVAPLALAFSGYVALSNEAYLYCSVPFIQICKQLNPVLVYTGSVGTRQEKPDWITGGLLLVVTVGCLVAIRGELAFSVIGLMFQMGGQFSNVIKVVAQQYLLQGSKYKMDSLSMVLLSSFLSLIPLTPALYYVWTSEILVSARKHWVILSTNCALAVFLDVCAATVVKHASGVTFIVAGVVKNILIVVFAAAFFETHLDAMQWGGYGIAVLATAFYTKHRHGKHRSNEARRASQLVSPTGASSV
jgi:drug/metabolite transporter (DMT)-like permease